MIFVNYEDCTGCGACIDPCEFNAIFIQNDKATIDQDRCEGCGACIEACPIGAIVALENEPQTEKILIKTDPVPIEARNDPAPIKTPLREIVLPAIGSVLLWTGQELVPRLANLALKTLDQRFFADNQNSERDNQQNNRGINRIHSSNGGGRHRRLRQRRNKRM